MAMPLDLYVGALLWGYIGVGAFVGGAMYLGYRISRKGRCVCGHCPPTREQQWARELEETLAARGITVAVAALFGGLMWLPMLITMGSDRRRR